MDHPASRSSSINDPGTKFFPTTHPEVPERKKKGPKKKEWGGLMETDGNVEKQKTVFPHCLAKPCWVSHRFHRPGGDEPKNQNRTLHLLPKPDIFICYGHHAAAGSHVMTELVGEQSQRACDRRAGHMNEGAVPLAPIEVEDLLELGEQRRVALALLDPLQHGRKHVRLHATCRTLAAAFFREELRDT